MGNLSSALPSLQVHDASDSLSSTSTPIQGYTDVWTSVEFRRGAFREIDASRIDLPPIAGCPPSTWIGLLPAFAQRLFQSENGGLLNNFRSKVVARYDVLPPPRVSELPGHFAKVISRACAFGMIVWSNVSADSVDDRKFSDAITESSFAECKDSSSDRLISWPRVQNDLSKNRQMLIYHAQVCSLVASPPRSSTHISWL